MTKARVNEIDLLRFIAALSVVIYHYTFRGYAADNLSIMPYPLLAPYTKYGHFGVELFFIISGFVILMTAANGSLQAFIISRLVRLYPAFWACCTITFIVIATIGAPRFTASIKEYLINLTMLSEFVDTPSIDGAYWSLFVEIRFYVFVGIILALGRIHQAEFFILLWLFVSVAIVVFDINKFRYLLIIQYSSYFIAGATFYLIWSRGLTTTRILTILVAWELALLQTVKGITRFEQTYNTNINCYITSSIISSFFLIMLLISLRRSGFWGRKRWQLAGALTYPVYLLHQNIGYMIFNLAYPSTDPHLLLWGTVLLVMIMAYLVHILIEKRYSLPMKNALIFFFNSIQRKTIKHAL